MKKHFVIARYNEELNWLEPFIEQIEYTLYNKGNQPPHFINNYHQKPNIGRESETYLSYIISNYYNLPDLVVFLQGNPFDHISTSIKEIIDYKALKPLYMGDDYFCDLNGNPDHGGLDIEPVLKQLELPYNNLLFFNAGANMIIPKENILKHSYWWWLDAYMIHQNTPQNSWIFERIYQNIFN